MINRHTSSIVKTVILPVITVFVVCAVVLLVIDRQTGDIVSENAREHELRVVKNLMALPEDDIQLDDYLVIEDYPTYIGKQIVTVYRARQDNKYIGVVFKPVIARGYSGPIELAVGITADGTIVGVDVLAHRETEGLGDRIEKQKSDWLSIFNNVSLSMLQPQDWNTRSHGGKFDQISGATVTSRGVINAIRKTLEYHQLNHAKLYSE